MGARATDRPEPNPQLCPGAAWDGSGVDFSIWSPSASRVTLCLFNDPDGRTELSRIELQPGPDGLWRAYVPGVRPGQLYAYRLDGPFEPSAGHRFNPHKLIIDPCARALSAPLRWHELMQDHSTRTPGSPPHRDTRDSADVMPLSVVVDAEFDWGDDRPPRTPWDQTLIYECHVRGLTIQHPDIEKSSRGTYSALASAPIIRHLRELGVTTLELLPVQQFLDEQHQVQRRLRNFWGYSPIAYFAPEARYAKARHGGQVIEFKHMVRELHRAGIEVIIDVVYNHTGEGDHRGPTLCFRGIENAAYYRLDPTDQRRYLDSSGCGNSLNTADPRVLQLILDSLRYWVQDMHVDGFRFDLAPALQRGLPPDHQLWQTFRNDPVLRHVKLIAEPWEVGPDGYRLGKFPPGWSEWNDRFRDRMRRFWRGDPGQIGELAYALTGSSDVFQPSGRSPSAGINFITAHDGFTLHDLVSYEHNHNHANGEHNRDGTHRNFSRNWGAEGPTDDPHIQDLRDRVKRSMFAALAFSRGVPMISSGDELGRTQHGNNNAYCQDNELSWLDWELDQPRREFLSFARRVFALRRDHPVLSLDCFYSGSTDGRGPARDLVWVREDGAEMTQADWLDARRTVVGMVFASSQTTEALLLLLNGGPMQIAFQPPGDPWSRNGAWQLLEDTASPPNHHTVPRPLILAPHSLQLLKFEPRP